MWIPSDSCLQRDIRSKTSKCKIGTSTSSALKSWNGRSSTKLAIQTACLEKQIGPECTVGPLARNLGLQIRPDYRGFGRKIGKSSPKIGNQGKIPWFWGYFFQFSFRDLFRDLFVSHFGPKARNQFSITPSWSQDLALTGIAVKKERTSTISVRAGFMRIPLSLLKSGLVSLEKKGTSVLNFGWSARVHQESSKIETAQALFPINSAQEIRSVFMSRWRRRVGIPLVR